MAMVMCMVTGGVTGTRIAPLKGEDGKIRHFDTLEDANKEAERLEKAMNTGFGLARFSYSGYEG